MGVKHNLTFEDYVYIRSLTIVRKKVAAMFNVSVDTIHRVHRDDMASKHMERLDTTTEAEKKRIIKAHVVVPIVPIMQARIKEHRKKLTIEQIKLKNPFCHPFNQMAQNWNPDKKYNW